MNISIRSECLLAVNTVRLAEITGHFSSRLFNNKIRRRHIPGVKIVFPKSVEPAAGHVAEIERRGAGAPDVVAEGNKRFLKSDVIFRPPRVVTVVRKSRAEEGSGKLRRF